MAWLSPVCLNSITAEPARDREAMAPATHAAGQCLCCRAHRLWQHADCTCVMTVPSLMQLGKLLLSRTYLVLVKSGMEAAVDQP